MSGIANPATAYKSAIQNAISGQGKATRAVIQFCKRFSGMSKICSAHCDLHCVPRTLTKALTTSDSILGWQWGSGDKPCTRKSKTNPEKQLTLPCDRNWVRTMTNGCNIRLDCSRPVTSGMERASASKSLGWSKMVVRCSFESVHLYTYPYNPVTLRWEPLIFL